MSVCNMMRSRAVQGGVKDGLLRCIQQEQNKSTLKKVTTYSATAEKAQPSDRPAPCLASGVCRGRHVQP